MSGARLEATGLACVRGRRRLFHDLHFSLHAGAMLHIVGENGAGKTSLLRLLCGLSLPEAGEVYFNRAPILKNRADYHRDLAYLGHRLALNAQLTPAENLNAMRALHDRAAVATDDALHRFGLADCARLPCGLLSAGQRQRVALAALSLRTGGVWLLDEPATNLDDAGLGFLEAMLREQIDAGGMVVFASHRQLTAAATPQLRLARFQ